MSSPLSSFSPPSFIYKLQCLYTHCMLGILLLEGICVCVCVCVCVCDVHACASSHACVGSGDNFMELSLAFYLYLIPGDPTEVSRFVWSLSLIRLSSAVIRHHGQKQVGEERFYFISVTQRNQGSH